MYTAANNQIFIILNSLFKFNELYIYNNNNFMEIM